MTITLPITKPSLGEAEAEAARQAILSGWVTQGPQVAAFEQEFAAYVGAPHACAVSSCTTALHLALLVLGVGPDDEVITVSHSYVATANSVRYCGAQPVFVDIDPQTYNLNPALLEAAITPRTKAILAVHQMGFPCDLPAICAIAERHHLPVVEDAACAIGSAIRLNAPNPPAPFPGRSLPLAREGGESTFDSPLSRSVGEGGRGGEGYWAGGLGAWQRIGAPRGVIACFSFHPRKVITTGDGGMLTTRDADLDRQFRLLRQHGMSVNDRQRHESGKIIFEDHLVVGYNYRMTDIQAAVGRVQLQRLPELLARRIALAERYAWELRDIPGLAMPQIPDTIRPNFQSYPVRVLPDFPLQRDELMQFLLDQGIASRRGIMNAHQETAYANLPPQHLPHSEAARDNILLLPLFPDMSDADLCRVVAALKQAL